MVITELSGSDLFFSLFEGVFFVLLSCVIALKLTNILTGHTDNILLWGGFLFGQSLMIDLFLVFIYINLAPLGITFLGFELFDYLSSSYCELVAIISVSLLPLVCILLTKSRIE
ncbi:MAG: hypothetical protein ACXADY_02755 [Candidatus Hodarchaeales archaeon]|jgi:hypothetical protein